MKEAGYLALAFNQDEGKGGERDDQERGNRGNNVSDISEFFQSYLCRSSMGWEEADTVSLVKYATRPGFKWDQLPVFKVRSYKYIRHGISQ